MSSREPTLQQPSQEGHSITPNKTQGTSQVKKKKRDSLVEEFRKNREERTKMLRQISEQGNTPVHIFLRVWLTWYVNSPQTKSPKSEHKFVTSLLKWNYWFWRNERHHYHNIRN